MIRPGVTWECDESRADDPNHEWPDNPIGSQYVRFTAVIDAVDDDYVELTVTRSNPHTGSPDPGAELAKSADRMCFEAKWQPYDEPAAEGDREADTETNVVDEDCVVMCDGGIVADDPGEDSGPTQLDGLDAKALTTPMSVLPEGPGVEEAADMWLVLHQVEHVVADVGGELTCDCKGNQFGHKCYHIRRVEFELGCREIPAWVNRERIDDQVGAHVDATPQFADDQWSGSA